MIRVVLSRLFAVLAPAMLVTMTPVCAQPAPTGVTAAQFNDPGVIDLFATCIVGKHPSQAAQYILNDYSDWRTAPWGTPGELKDKTCVPGQASIQDARLLLKLSENSVKVALADALVRREFPTFDPAIIQTAKPLPSGTLVDRLFPPDACKKCSPKQMAEFQDARTKLNNVMAPIIFGECAVRTDPAKAHALLMTMPGSAEEKAAFGVLAPALDSCVVQGVQFTATRSALRGLIAISYYRVAHAPRLAPAGSKKS